MTETHKAAVEALESYLRKCDFHGHRVLSKPMPTDADVQRFRSALEALKQPSSVEVTETEAINLVINSWTAGCMDNTVEYVIRRSVQELAGYRITRAAATDGVKS